MARTTIRTEDITDSEVTTAKILDDNVTTAKVLDNNVTLAKLDDGTQGDILYYGASGAPTRLGFGTSGDFLKTQGTGANPAWATVTEYDDSGVQDDIALLGFKVATNGSLGKYNLVDQTEDSFQDESGIDTSGSTDEVYDASGKFYSGTTAGGVSFTNTYTTVETVTWTADTGTVEVLVVAGGGGGGHVAGGGGGAGGVSYHASKTVTQGNDYTITVGDGGAGGASGGARGASGGDSVFGDITSDGGGGGGGSANNTGIAGGSGGGGGGDAGGAGGATTQGATGGATGYGFAGGPGYHSSSDDNGGGGGGASQAGETAGSYNPGDGGDGYTSSISGGSVVYGGGAGAGSKIAGTGGPGGTGGGGNGGNSSGVGQTAGTDGLGGGGGGGGGSPYPAGQDGGSGIVIVKGSTVAAYNDMTLISASTTAESVPTTGDIVMTYSNGAGTAVANTDIKAYISRDGSAYTSAVTLADQGDTGGHTILTAHNVDLSGITSGSTMRFKIETLNQAVGLQTKIHAVSLGWS